MVVWPSSEWGVRATPTPRPIPHNRNMPTLHTATLLGETCCVRLATVLQRVATCWVLLPQV